MTPQRTLQSLIDEVVAKRTTHLQAVTKSTDMTNQRDLQWKDAITAYGSYATHLGARLGQREATGIEHYWQEREYRAAASNAHNEGFAFSTLTEAANLPSKKTNVCQIFSGMVGASESQLAEARMGRYGQELRDFIADQTAAELKGILKDVDGAALTGTYSAVDPRAMKSLAGTIGTWNGFIATNQINVSAAAIDEDDFDDAYEAIWEQTNGEYFPNAIYCSNAVAREMKGWTDKVRFMIDVAQPETMTMVKAGVAVGYYQSQHGVSSVFIHPGVPHDSNTEANNFVLLLHEPLIKFAVLRGLQQVAPAVVGDYVQSVLVAEMSLECRIEVAHALIHNFSA